MRLIVAKHWEDNPEVAIRVQRGREAKVGGVGSELRPSSEWIEGEKTRNKLPGTAGFRVPDPKYLPDIIDSMKRNGYKLRSGDRLVLIGGDRAWDADMPEEYASAIRNARILHVFEDSEIPEELKNDVVPRAEAPATVQAPAVAPGIPAQSFDVYRNASPKVKQMMEDLAKEILGPKSLSELMQK